MNFYPAIDLKDGKCIRLKKGELNDITFYNPDPVDQASQFIEMGAKWIHMVDIEGAFKGKNFNHKVFIDIKKKFNCYLQVGGGIRNFATVEFLIKNKIDRVVLGTIALKNKKLCEQICKSFPGKIALGIDAKKGWVATDGWAKTSKVKVSEMIKSYEGLGVSCVIFTDIEKDGVLAGVSFDQLESILNQTSIKIIASGGVSSLGDLKRLKEISDEKKNLEGVIVGRAIYENKINIKEAIKILK